MRRYKLAAALILLYSFTIGQTNPVVPSNSNATRKIENCMSGTTERPLKVKKVLDFQTIELSNGQQVRYFGVKGMSGDLLRSDSQVRLKNFHRKIVEGKNVEICVDAKEDLRGEILLGRVYFNKALVLLDLLLDAFEAIFEDEKKVEEWAKGEEVMGTTRFNEKIFYFERDKVFVNATLIKNGLAVASKSAGEYQKLFEELEREAKEHKRGFWSAAPSN